MIELKLYLYDSTQETNGYRGTDLSRYILMGTQNTEDLTQVVDITEITLAGYPTGVAFAPETMFVLDEVEDGVILRTFHRVVKDDYVSQPILSRVDYFDHSITLTEPSVIAQKRIVDNMAITYQLKKVKLETRQTFDIFTARAGLTVYKDTISLNRNELKGWSAYTQTDPFGAITSYYDLTTIKVLYFDNPIICTTGTSSDNLQYRYIDISSLVGNSMTVKIPRLMLWGAKENTYLSTIEKPVSMFVSIRVFNKATPDTLKINIEKSFVSNADLAGFAGAAAFDGSTKSNVEWIPEFARDGLTGNIYNLHYYAIPLYRRYTDVTAPDSSYSEEARTITLNGLASDDIITISVRPLSLPDNAEVFLPKYTGTSFTRRLKTHSTYVPSTDQYNTSVQSTVYIPEQSYTTTIEYEIYATESIRTILESGIPYTCENLIKKAFLNSSLFPRKAGFTTANLDETEYNCPFYIDPAYVPKLQTTQVNETFFNQKNLWEVLIEAGHYIHAIPELVFGQNNKFMLTFHELGSTERKTNAITRSSIMNFQGVDDYVCELNSYIQNYVQLGGETTEWVAAKSTDDSFLVYNDNAQIVTSLPIIELLNVTIRANADDSGITAGSQKDATSYFYEKNVYAILSVSYTDVPNKGIAMYYTLGDNKIVGGDYRLPRPSADKWNDYTIKKIIYSAFKGYPITVPSGSELWTDLKVNNFSFRVTYRTKSFVRQSHTRPDVRKYLVNSKFDETPQHKQMNNQTDVVVDSNKYGSNMYGTLLKTGNNNYEMQGWYSHLSELPRKGDLHRINGDNYYVAKIENTYYSNHIESKITYSKDYNELSKIIGIPSEPRFYEISEQSLINRQVSIDDYLIVTTNQNDLSPNNADGYLEDTTHLQKLVLGGISGFAKYAMVAFKGDLDIGTQHATFGDASLYVEVMHPLNAYSSGNTLTYSWTMKDNFSAGDKVGKIQNAEVPTADSAYRAMTAVQYTDKYGKATLFDFFILEDYSFSTEAEINNLPESPVTAKGDKTIKNVNILATNVDVNDENYNQRGLILLKDCRERISFNYNLRLITSSDRFVTSPYFFSPKSATTKLALLYYDEVNKLSSGFISTTAITYTYDIPDSAIVQVNGTNVYGQTKPVAFSVNIGSLIGDQHFTGENVPKFKAIALVTNYNSQTTLAQFTLARNIDESMTKDEVKATWYFGVPKNSYFSKRQ